MIGSGRFSFYFKAEHLSLVFHLCRYIRHCGIFEVGDCKAITRLSKTSYSGEPLCRLRMRASI